MTLAFKTLAFKTKASGLNLNGLTWTLACIVLAGCGSPTTPAVQTISGETMGTTYNVSYPAHLANSGVLKASTDSLLFAVNASLSTYIPSSLISRVNASNEPGTFEVDKHFATVYLKAAEVYQQSGGAFNPAIGPLISAWGFGAQEPQALSASEVASLMSRTSFSAFAYDAQSLLLTKTVAGAQLDFSAIAKGYGVDAVGTLLEEKGISSYFVEIGGEVRTRGRHPAGRPWRAGIDVPTTELSAQRQVLIAIAMDNRSMATSGNYRNYYVRDGQKYVHTINPKTGYPEESDLLSASVLAPDCMTADAFATAFMVMGSDKAFELAASIDGIEAYLITSDASGKLVETKTAGFPPAVELPQETR